MFTYGAFFDYSDELSYFSAKIRLDTYELLNIHDNDKKNTFLQQQILISKLLSKTGIISENSELTSNTTQRSFSS